MWLLTLSPRGHDRSWMIQYLTESEVLLNNYAHWQPNACGERQPVEWPSFPPQDYLSSEVLTDHGPIIHH